MNTRPFSGRMDLASLVMISWILASPVFAQDAAQQPTGAAVPVASANNEVFAKLRAQCEATGCSRTGGDVCADAATVLLGEDLPDAYREMDKNQVRKIAVRLLEKATDHSNRARVMAYDIYAGASGGLSFLLMDPNKDPVRAVELLDMMEKSGYVPGIMRKLKSLLSLLSSGDKDSVAACNKVRAMLAKGGLDRESLQMAKEIDEDTMRCPKPLQ